MRVISALAKLLVTITHQRAGYANSELFPVRSVCLTDLSLICAVQMSENIFFNPIPFPFPLVIPIHSRSHSRTASSILIRQRMTSKLNNAHN